MATSGEAQASAPQLPPGPLVSAGVRAPPSQLITKRPRTFSLLGAGNTVPEQPAPPHLKAGVPLLASASEDATSTPICPAALSEPTLSAPATGAVVSPEPQRSA